MNFFRNFLVFNIGNFQKIANCGSRIAEIAAFFELRIADEKFWLRLRVMDLKNPMRPALLCLLTFKTGKMKSHFYFFFFLLINMGVNCSPTGKECINDSILVENLTDEDDIDTLAHTNLRSFLRDVITERRDECMHPKLAKPGKLKRYYDTQYQLTMNALSAYEKNKNQPTTTMTAKTTTATTMTAILTSTEKKDSGISGGEQVWMCLAIAFFCCSCVLTTILVMMKCKRNSHNAQHAQQPPVSTGHYPPPAHHSYPLETGIHSVPPNDFCHPLEKRNGKNRRLVEPLDGKNEISMEFPGNRYN